MCTCMCMQMHVHAKTDGTTPMHDISKYKLITEHLCLGPEQCFRAPKKCFDQALGFEINFGLENNA